MKVFAGEVSLDKIGGPGFGPFGDVGGEGAGIAGVAKIVSSTIGVITVAAFIWFMFQFLIGGLNWLTSGGEKQKLQEARDRMTNAFVGLVIVVAGWGIIALIGQFLGVKILDPESLIGNLKI